MPHRAPHIRHMVRLLNQCISPRRCRDKARCAQSHSGGAHLTPMPIGAPQHLPGLATNKAAFQGGSIDFEMVIKHGGGEHWLIHSVRGGGSFSFKTDLTPERRGRHG